MTAITIAINARRVDESRASRALSTSKNVDHHRVEKPFGGQVSELAVLKDNMKIKSSGIYRRNRRPYVVARSEI
jgi:hypothetical protein